MNDSNQQLRKYFVCYEYGERGRVSQANKGWSIVDVIQTETGSKEDIPEIYRLQDETHYFYLVEAVWEDQAVKLAEARHKDGEYEKGLVWV